MPSGTLGAGLSFTVPATATFGYNTVTAVDSVRGYPATALYVVPGLFDDFL